MLKILTVIMLLFVPLTAGAAYQVKFVSETPAERPLHVAVDHDGKMFITGKNGNVVITGADGKPLMTLRNKDADGNTLLKKPNGIALYRDTIYITDTSQDRVVMFAKNGAYLDSFGGGGSAPKEFSNPRGIFVNQGLIYVADYSNDRIQIFGPNGVYLRSIGNSGEGEALLKSPTDVAVDYQGLIYAVDSDNGMVKIYKPTGEYAGKLTGLKKPRSLAITDDGIFVTDLENCNIVKFSLKGEWLFAFGSMGTGRVQFQELTGIYTDSRGNVYAADVEKGTVQVIATEQGQAVDPLDKAPPPTSVRWLRNINRTLLKIYWDQPRSRLYAIDDDKDTVLSLKDDKLEQTLKIADWTPAAVAVDRNGAVWVVDRSESRLLKLSPEGKLLLTVGSAGSRPGSLSKPRDIAIADDGIIYVADSGNDRVQVFDTEGVFHFIISGRNDAEALNNPTALALDGNGNLYVLSAADKVVFCYSPKGKVLRRFGDAIPGGRKLEKPVALTVMGNELLVLDADPGNIKVFSLSGEFLREFGAKGEGKGDFRNPSSLMVLDATRLMVSDYGNKRLQVLGMVYTPPPPRDFNAKGAMRSSELRWAAATDPPVEMFRVFRAKGIPQDFKEIARITTLIFQDNDVTPGSPYYYRVSAIARDGNETVARDIVKALPTRYKSSPPKDLQAQSQEWSVDLTWAANKEKFVDHYTIYRRGDKEDAVPELVGQSKTPSFTDGGLEEDTSYIFSVAAVSTDDVESARTAIEVKTLVATKPPLEIEVLQLSDIFSNTYKIYETEGIGKLRLSNNTRAQIGSLKLSFAIKKFMDYPSETEIRDLPARDSREVPLKAVFNNKILEVTEDTPVQTEITVTYYINQKPRVYTRNHTINLYEKHRMLWIEKDRIATFITSKDPVLLEFARSVVTQYGEMNSPLVYAGAIFDYLGHTGMTYLQHPTNPYQVTKGKTDTVDYVQYPRETLKRNSGVCTDLVVLYSAALESLGIKTKLIGVPGHLLMMFALGPVSELGDDTMNGMLAIHDGYVWVPVELTIVGAPFMKAWETGSKTYLDQKSRGLELIEPGKAWSRYKPATLPFSDWRAPIAGRAELDKRYNNEMAKLNKITLKYMSSRYSRILTKNPNDPNALIQLGIIYGEGRELDEAMKFFDKAERLSPNNATIKNNLANLFYLRGNYKKAMLTYERAAELDSDDPYILVNLALCYLRMDMKNKATEVFRKATDKNSEVGQKYRVIAMELLGNI